MSKTKKLLKLAFVIELLVGIFLLIFYKPAACTVDCLNGLNELVLYLLPVVGLTIFAYISIKIYEKRANKQQLKPDQKFLQFFVSGIVLLTIVYGLYYWFNR
jgi:quinol-cytochrome oxidoreductase complex cytochrome b subunit